MWVPPALLKTALKMRSRIKRSRVCSNLKAVDDLEKSWRVWESQRVAYVGGRHSSQSIRNSGNNGLFHFEDQLRGRKNMTLVVGCCYIDIP
jgi:hypothetical protein